MLLPNNKHRTEAKSAWTNKHSTSTCSLHNHSQWCIKYSQASISGNELHTNKFLTLEFRAPQCYRDLFYARIWEINCCYGMFHHENASRNYTLIAINAVNYLFSVQWLQSHLLYFKSITQTTWNIYLSGCTLQRAWFKQSLLGFSLKQKLAVWQSAPFMEA